MRRAEQYAEILEYALKRRRANHIDSFYPEKGDLRRELYTKHLEFFSMGDFYRERCFMGGNRIGKTEGVGCYELALHLTGIYPHWWTGRRFDKPIKAWAAGKTTETVRDILQQKLLGPILNMGSGLIRRHLIGRVTRRSGVADAVDTAKIMHSSGEESVLGLKTYSQGRSGFEGTERDLILMDEEPEAAIYEECLMRTATTQGLIMLTFTPLEGMSDVVMSYLPSNA